MNSAKKTDDTPQEHTINASEIGSAIATITLAFAASFFVIKYKFDSIYSCGILNYKTLEITTFEDTIIISKIINSFIIMAIFANFFILFSPKTKSSNTNHNSSKNTKTIAFNKLLSLKSKIEKIFINNQKKISILAAIIISAFFISGNFIEQKFTYQYLFINISMFSATFIILIFTNKFTSIAKITLVILSIIIFNTLFTVLNMSNNNIKNKNILIHTDIAGCEYIKNGGNTKIYGSEKGFHVRYKNNIAVFIPSNNVKFIEETHDQISTKECIPTGLLSNIKID